MAITSRDDLITALCATTSQRRTVIYPNAPGNSVGMWYDMWLSTSTWGTGKTPATGAGELCDHTMLGAYPLTSPAGGDQEYLVQFDAGANVQGSLMLYDRLWHVGGLDQNSISVQTITGTNMTRPDANGYDVEVWVVTQLAGNTFNPLITLHYSDHGGNNHSATTTPGTSMFNNLYGAFPLNLAAGDNSVQNIISVQLGSAGTSGKTFELVCLRRIATIPIRAAGLSLARDVLSLAMPKIYSGACLSMMFGTASAAGAFVDCHIGIAEK